MRFAYLGSGSRGNAALIETSDTKLMLDCGFSVNECLRRLSRLGVDAAEIDALLVTHEHGDHIRGVGRLARRFGLPVYMTPGTWSAARIGRIKDLHQINCHEPFSIGDVTIEPLPVPHDAREPCQYVFESRGRRLGVLTDTGHVTTHIRQSFRACDALVIEFNHDLDMLEKGPYSRALKARIAGRFGHLSNDQAAELVAEVAHGDLQHVMAVHISEKNNTPDVARRAVYSGLTGCSPAVHCAHQETGAEWRTIE